MCYRRMAKDFLRSQEALVKTRAMANLSRVTACPLPIAEKVRELSRQPMWTTWCLMLGYN